eukprot:scaffold267064_cov32-Tisochrysis_lutea.AAC.2
MSLTERDSAGTDVGRLIDRCTVGEASPDLPRAETAVALCDGRVRLEQPHPALSGCSGARLLLELRAHLLELGGDSASA